MWTDLSTVLSQFTRVTDRRTDGHGILIARPRLYSMQRGKNLRFITVTLIMLKNSKNQCKKLLSLKHSVRATKVTPLKQQKLLCLIPRYA